MREPVPNETIFTPEWIAAWGENALAAANEFSTSPKADEKDEPEDA